MLAYEEVTAGPEQVSKQQEDIYFGGFAQPDENDYFALFRDWKMISCHINNLAELKVVEYVLQLTWGNNRPMDMMPLTLDSFMHGYIDAYGQRTDDGTGLSKQSVATGIEKAMKHGLIEREVEYWTDEDGRTRATRYYGLHFYVPVEVQNVDSEYFPDGSEGEIIDSVPDQFVEANDLGFQDETALEADCVESQKVGPSTNSSYPSRDNNTDRKVIRIRERQKVNKPEGKRKYPAFIKSYIEELSHNFGDKEHTGSNIAQTTNLYERSGMSEIEFTQVLDEAKELARGKPIKKMNSRKWPNRMPFFFGCLRNLLETAHKQPPCNSL